MLLRWGSLSTAGQPPRSTPRGLTTVPSSTKVHINFFKGPKCQAPGRTRKRNCILDFSGKGSVLVFFFDCDWFFQSKIYWSPLWAENRHDKFLGSRSETGEECWLFWAWVSGVRFLGGPRTLEKRGRKNCGNDSLTNSLRKLRAIFRLFDKPPKNIPPNPLCRTSGTRYWERNNQTTGNIKNIPEKWEKHKKGKRTKSGWRRRNWETALLETCPKKTWGGWTTSRAKDTPTKGFPRLGPWVLGHIKARGADKSQSLAWAESRHASHLCSLSSCSALEADFSRRRHFLSTFFF